MLLNIQLTLLSWMQNSSKVPRNLLIQKKENFEGKRNNIICNYCKKPGHIDERCYRIIGHPTDFKFTKNKRFQNGVQGNAVLTADDNANQSVANAERGITQEQYNNLYQLLQQVKYAPQGEISSEVNVTANCAGIPSHSFSDVSNFVVWILDSGAFEHMTCDFTLLFNIQTLIKHVFVNLPKSQRVKVHQARNV